MKDNLNAEIERMFFNGYSRKAIAEKLGITVNVVRSRLQIMRKKKEVKRWWQD